jgi:hypothetical protein
MLSKLSFILVIIFAGNTSTCLAGERVNKSLVVVPNSIVFVDIPRGFVEIHGWQKKQVMVEGELDDTVNKLIFTVKENKTLIKLDTHGQEHWGDGSTLNIFMPQQAQLRFNGIDTSFTITQLKNHIEGKSINGDLVVNKSQGKIKLATVSGDVTLIESSGLVKIKSVSGTIDYSGDFEKASLKSMSGNITAEISATSHLLIKNISGDTHISGHVKNQGQLHLTSVSGNIEYQVTDDLNAECEVVSQFGGEISNQLTDDLPVVGNLHKNTLNFTSGDGSGKLTMNTVSGSVYIKKSKKIKK